jgi:hypothetical protein
MVKVIRLEQDQINAMTPVVKPYLDKGLKELNGELTLDTIIEAVLQGRNECWVVYKDINTIYAVITTEVIRYDTGRRVVRIVLCGGESMDKWLDDFLSRVKDYAVAMEVDAIEVVGRKGWEKVLKDKGYKYAYTGLLMEV